MPAAARRELLAMAELLEHFGPTLKRPHADMLAGSRIANLKELRFSADGGAWRVAYAFNTKRTGILLVAGNKSGVAQARFYRVLIATAERRFKG